MSKTRKFNRNIWKELYIYFFSLNAKEKHLIYDVILNMSKYAQCRISICQARTLKMTSLKVTSVFTS